MLARILRAPVTHFLLIGGLLFSVTGPGALERSRTRRQERPRIVITEGDIERLTRDWELQYGSPPSPGQREALIQEAIDEEILHREAFAMGLHRDDRVVRARLVQIARFLNDDPEQEDEALEREARNLGLDRTDLVIRRYLVQTMRLLIGKARPSDFPTQEQLEEYFAGQREKFIHPEQLRLTHVYLSREKRGAGVAEDAEHLLAVVRRRGVDPETAPAMGDAFVRGFNIGPVSRADVERIFGPVFGEMVAQIEPGTWTGPVASSYGLHLVWLHERIPATLPPIEAVRSRVLHRFLRDGREERMAQRMQALRERCDITVEGPSVQTAGSLKERRWR